MSVRSPAIRIPRRRRSFAALTLTAVLVACTAPSPSVSPTPSPAASQASPTDSPTDSPTAEPTTPGPTLGPTDTPAASQTPDPIPSPTPQAPQSVEMPFVPVVGFWSTRASIPLAELRAEAAAGRVLVTSEDAEAVSAVLGPLPAEAQRQTADEIMAAVKDGGLGLLRATDVVPRVRALAIDGSSLFGNERIEDVSQWPVIATVQSSEAWDQSASWTLVAAGDMQFDRLVRTAIEASGQGRSYPFDGGTARVTRTRCCSYFNYVYPDVARTGNNGLMRALISGADMTMGNLESAVLYDAPHHPEAHTFTFTTDASWMQDLADVGFDLLSTANNHSGDAGERGLATAVEAITAAGMAPAGAGLGDDVFAPAFVEANGTSVAVIACSAIRGSNEVRPDPDRVLAMSCNDGNVARVIRETRDEADVVIVFPHWGVEYYPTPRAYQRQLAAEWVEAGADMIVGAHSHFPGAIEDIDGRLVFYSLGNFIFDQSFRQATMMGLVPEITFNGAEPVQAWLHTTLIVDDSQPNLADPDGDGQFAYDLIRQGSRNFLDY
jgi:hypothetical protein